MFQKAVFPGKYIQGVDAINELPSLIGLLGKQGLILASPSVGNKVLPQCGIDPVVQGIHIELFRGECCENELSRLSGIITQRRVDVLVGMGGGKTIDTAKIVADRLGIPVIVVPTIASTDAPCSGCAVLYSNDGVFESVFYQKANPAAVLVDLNIIAASPTRFLVAGMGDADQQRLMLAAEKACAPEQPIHHEAGEVTPAAVFSAMLVADALGKARRAGARHAGQ